MGSPRPDAQQISVRPAVTRLFIHSLRLQQGAVCAAHIVKAAFLMSSSSASVPPSLFPSPLSHRLSPPSLYPSPSSSLPPSVSSGCMQQSSNSRGEAPKETARGLKQRRFGQKGSRTDSKRTAAKGEKEQEESGREGRGRMEEEEWVSGRAEGRRREKLLLLQRWAFLSPVPARSKVYRGFNFTFPQPIRARPWLLEGTLTHSENLTEARLLSRVLPFLTLFHVFPAPSPHLSPYMFIRP